ncbi:MAG: winged-helix domain-containing protein [Candidatus Nanoarchaeia archaeon]|nr:winged-helix domain-containing protein [Candidatus Nanoarchaeia archaeon]MDD5239429.1 winged-helix domain-containing protein [Candidatus Nanoarchaeia archaeon]
MGKVFKDKPIAEIILRRFERPFNENTDSLIRKFCISIGLLQPGDSRDVVADIFKLLLEGRKERKIFSSKEIEDSIRTQRDTGVAGSNIRRQLLRMEKMGLIEKNNNGYRFKEFMGLNEILSSQILKFLIEPTFERIKEYADEIDKRN